MAAKKRNANESALLEMMGDHAEKPVAVTNEGLALVSSLIKLQFDQELKVAQLEDDLKEAKKRLSQTSEVDLPEAMKQCGVKSFVTEDNLEVELKEDVNVGISEANREPAYHWLKSHEFDGLIKSDLAMHFDKDQLEKADKLVEALRKKGYEVEVKQSIHYQTLKAFVKEQLADGERYTQDDPFPMDLFGARPYQVAKVKPRKTPINKAKR